MAQVIVAVQILVAKRDAMNALGHQRFDRVLDAVLPAAIPETSRNLPGQADTAIVSRSNSAPAFDVTAAVESRCDFPASEVGEIERIRTTLVIGPPLL